MEICVPIHNRKSRQRRGLAFLTACLALSLLHCGREAPPKAQQEPRPAERSFALTDTQRPYLARTFSKTYSSISASSSYLAGDDTATTVSIGFDFYFYGRKYSQITLSTNGALTFGGHTGAIYANNSIPNTAASIGCELNNCTIDNALVPWWDDMYVDNLTDVTYQTVGTTPYREFIVQYENWRPYGGTNKRKMQVHIFETSNRVEFHYGPIDNATATNESASAGLIEPTNEAVYSLAALSCTPNCNATHWPQNKVISFSSPYETRKYKHTFVEISGTSANLTGIDARTSALPLGFDFPFYGQRFSSVVISGNGRLSFGTFSADYANKAIPYSGDTLTSFIAGWWDDMSIDGSSDIQFATLGTAPKREFIAQWKNWHPYGGTNKRRMQIHLFEGSGRIEIHYGAIDSTTTAETASIGIEDQSASSDSLSALTCGSSCSASNWPTHEVIAFVRPFSGYRMRGETNGYAGSSFTYAPLDPADPGVTTIDLSDSTGSIRDIGFIIEVDGEKYDTVSLSRSGVLGFGGFFSITGDNVDVADNDLLQPGGFVPAVGPAMGFIAPWWDNFSVVTTDAVRDVVKGTPGEREYVAEWSAFRREGTTEDVTRPIQIHLFEKDNRIEIHYGTFGGTFTGESASAGLSTSKHAFKLLTCSPKCNSSSSPYYYWQTNAKFVIEEDTYQASWRNLNTDYFSAKRQFVSGGVPSGLWLTAGHCGRCHNGTVPPPSGAVPPRYNYVKAADTLAAFKTLVPNLLHQVDGTEVPDSDPTSSPAYPEDGSPSFRLIYTTGPDGTGDINIATTLPNMTYLLHWLREPSGWKNGDLMSSPKNMPYDAPYSQLKNEEAKSRILRWLFTIPQPF